MEAIKVMVRIVAILIGLLAGCATRKQSTNERTALHTRVGQTAKQERRLRRLEQTSSASIRLEYASNVAEIIPVGTFRLSVDSGYVGQAERVVIHRNSGRIAAAESDVAIAVVDSSAALAATREHTAVQRDTRMKQQEADVSPLLKIPWWVWLGVVCGVIYLVWRLWKR
ncbi:hypothetical protein [Parapedobacter soli]|uniref:hypothetical protein n=1 Tax=Parapedobacter soli TaxID=416955 RepID=UPI0021C60B3A|nr:hypothetical protein [Parapedobacter soli]